jgi:hypothetical protein
MNIAMIKASTFNMMNKKKNVNLFFVILNNVEKYFEKHNKSNIVIKNVLSIEYHEFLNVFDKKTFNTLVSHRFYDHKIVLKKNVIFEYTSLYKMFKKELKIVKKYLENNLEKKFIIVNRLSFASSIMFMKKINESLKFCVDYKKLNQLIKKNKYFLSLIDETLTHLNKTKYFIKLNIKQAFHLIKIADADFEDLIIFKIRFNAYKYRVFVTSSYARNVFFQLKKHISFSVVRARHDDKFVTRLTFVIRIVWFTELDDKNTAFFFLSNSFSYMKRNSSKKIWAKSEAIDRDVWRSRFADV